MTQYGFFIDLSRCIGCNACMISCKQWHDIEPGPVKWLRVFQWEKGAFPNLELRMLPIMCFHCETPVCMDACPNHAIYKENKYGAVLVDTGKCTGERECFKACPYGTPQFPNDERGIKMSKCTMCIDRLEEGLKPICVLSCSMRALEFGPIDELRKKYGTVSNVEGLAKEYPPCQVACPAGVFAEGYIEAVADGKFSEAINLFRETTPFAGVLGRVCTHPCELDCRRGKFDNAVSICALKRFIADKERQTGRITPEVIPVTKVETVAVIGGGPAGLSCAYDLVRQGYAVTVFEARPEAGGLMRYGIPAYRLPKDVVDEEIDYINSCGVEIRTGTAVKDVELLFNQGYSAIFVAVGTWESARLNVPGEDAEGVVPALEFLTGVNIGQSMKVGKKVVVIGGGSVAIDAARTALRIGAEEAHLICLECRDLTARDRMPAQDMEIEEAEQEGVIIHPCLGVKNFIVKDGKVTGIETMGCCSVYDENGRFNPEYDLKVKSPVLTVDTVIAAIGQTVNKDSVPSGVKTYGSGRILVDAVTLQTDNAKVFAGGDVVSGASNIVSAISAGKQAAESIIRYFKGVDLAEGRCEKIVIRNRAGNRSERVLKQAAGIKEGFTEVFQGISEEMAIAQAKRCVNCGKTKPSVVFRPVDRKGQVVPYDARKAMELWQKRHPDVDVELPDIFKDVGEVFEDHSDVIFRNHLELKAGTVKERLLRTLDDE